MVFENTNMSSPIDPRESFINDCDIGRFQDVQVTIENVTRIHGLVIDVDREYIAENEFFPPGRNGREFFEDIQVVLRRHEILKHAEVRFTGRNLHLIVKLEPCVEITSSLDRELWQQITIFYDQRFLPIPMLLR